MRNRRQAGPANMRDGRAAGMRDLRPLSFLLLGALCILALATYSLAPA